MSTCSVEGCGRPCRSRGWCTVHYGRWRRYGDPSATAARRRVTDSRGWIRCHKCGEFKPPDMMKWSNEQQRPRTICKRCHDTNRSPEALRRRELLHRERLAPLERARYRALQCLARLHQDEFAALYAIEVDRLDGEVLIGWQTVAEHERRLFGVPEDVH